jgi:uncharacterized protein YsxB (DUF464 family)
MIEVVLKATTNQLSIKSSGHADFNLKGKDIVCAAVSILLQGWILSEIEICKAKITQKQGEGFWKVILENYGGKDRLLFDSLTLTLLVLEKQYKENIKVTVEECDGR